MPAKLEAWEIEEMYKNADTNKDGKLLGDELLLFLRNQGFKISIEQGEKIFKQFDENGDGTISLLEFFKLMKALFPTKC